MPEKSKQLDGNFSILNPKSSDWSILGLLNDIKTPEIRKAARSSGFHGQTDILLASPNPTPSSPKKCEALGLFYVGESARKYGFNVEYWDERHDPEKDFLKKAANANVIGFTAITGFQLSGFVRLAEKIKSLWPDKKIILGGAHATLTQPETNLADPLVDYLVFGEGELRLPALLWSVYSKQGIEAVDGIGYKPEPNAFIVQGNRHVPDPQKHFVKAVSPWTEEYFLTAASRNQMILPTSRGCPWSMRSCTFCSVAKQYHGSYRAFPFELWQSDLLDIHAKTPVKHLAPEDENSAFAIRYNSPYLPLLKKIGATSHLHLRSDQLLDLELVKWLADMGVNLIHVGVESGNERVLNQIMKKNETVEHHIVAAKNLAKTGIGMVATFIVANPTETWQEANQTLDLAEEMSRFFQKNKFRATIYILAALPGTEIFHSVGRMHQFCDYLEKIAPFSGQIPESEIGQLRDWLKRIADPAKPYLERFLELKNSQSFERLREESKKWLWPTPGTLREWTQVSAAKNPFLDPKWNAIYYIAGPHFNRQKTSQNFPGAKRLLFKPFEILCDLRYKLRRFEGAKIEIWAMEKLLTWASRNSIGEEF